MFKNLRDKITPNDPNKSKKKSSGNNGDLTTNDRSDDLSKNSGGQNLSRFSSISSLVSDVGSAFSKTMTAPQHIQPSNTHLKVLFDNESISEYDDSISGGDVCTKEELFQRYQRAQAFARRYKTRYLEVSECYTKIESDNSKLRQILSDSQDKQIRRINELKEQIELDKQAKKDVEENYCLMIDEKVELVNVLKLQIKLLKEGKDLPPELEEQIKKKHEMEVLSDKKREDEIKELKNMLSQRENLLQRCKDKINSLNSQMNELKMKCENMQDVSISNDDTNKIFNEFSQERAHRVTDSENIEQEHNERIKLILSQFENKKIEYDQIFNNMKLAEQKMIERITNLTLENENLTEQFNIKTKIIQDLMNDQFSKSEEYSDPSILNTPLEKLKLCKLIINKYINNGHPIVDELSNVLSSIKIMPTVEMSSSYVGNNEDFNENISVSNSNELQKINELEEENKFLNSKIQQLENLKLICDEENINREKELVQANSVLEEEKKNLIIKCKQSEQNYEMLQDDVKTLCVKNEDYLQKLSDSQSILLKTETDKIALNDEKEILLKNFESLELSMNNLDIEKNKLFQELQKMCNEYNDLESKFTSVCNENQTSKDLLSAKQDECKTLTDKIDELITSISQLQNENDQLLKKFNGNSISISNKEEQMCLNVIEIQQKFNQEIEELKEKLNDQDKSNEEKSILIDQLNIQIKECQTTIDIFKQNQINHQSQNESLTNEIETQISLVKSNEEKIEEINFEKQLLQTQIDELSLKFNEILKEKDEIERKNESERIIKEELIHQIEQMTINSKTLQDDIVNRMKDYQNLSEENEKLINEIKKKSEQLNKEMEETSLITEKFNSTVVLLETCQPQLIELTEKHKSLTLENQSIIESLRQISNENESIKVELQDCKFTSSQILKEKELLISDIESKNSIIQSIQDEICNIKESQHELRKKITNLNKEKDDVVAVFNEKINLLEKEISEKHINNDNLTSSLENTDLELSDLMSKYTLLKDENDCLTLNLNKNLENIETLKSELLEKEEITSKYELLCQEKKIFTKQFDEYKEIISQKTIITNEDVINTLKEEIKNLDVIKTTLENQVSELSSKYSLKESEHLSMCESFDLERKQFEKSNEDKSKIIDQLEFEIKSHLESKKIDKEFISKLQKSIDEEIQMKNDLNSKINLMESYLCKFCSWIEELMIIEDCHGECNLRSPSTTSSSYIHWDDKMEAECSNCKILIFAGQSIEKLLSINHKFHLEFHEILKHSNECSKLQIEYQKKLEIVEKEVNEIYKNLCKCHGEPKTDIYAQIELITTTMSELNNQLAEKSRLLLEIESQCSQLMDILNIDNLSLIDNIPISHYLFGLDKKIYDIIHFYKNDSLIKEKSKVEYEKNMDEKVEKSNILLVQMFKQLISIFHLTDLHVNNFVDINKHNRKNLMKKLKEFVKHHDQLTNEIDDVNSKLLSTEKDLKLSIELNHNIQNELDDLRNSVANDRDRLIATGNELEMSMRRLNEVADEKGRIDEEKQTLRKELKELNEKISNLKLEFEKQSSEKERLEMQFDESLEKVKSNHTALEEMYNRELEKQHGYQRNLEQQIISHEKTSLKLSESERKLEEVLNQSEQLLDLNHQYKRLLDEAKNESTDVASKNVLMEKQNSELQVELDLVNSEKIELKKIIDNLNLIQNDITLDRDNLKDNLVALQNKEQELENLKTELEQTKLINETLENNLSLLRNENKESEIKIERIIQDKNEELNNLTSELEINKVNNDILKNKIGILESSNEQMIQKEKSLLTESSEINIQKIQFENETASLQQKLNDIEIKCHNVNIEKNQLLIQLNERQKSIDQLKFQNDDFKILIQSYKNQIDDVNLEIEQMKTTHEIEKEELEQRFAEEKSVWEDNLNRNLKKLTKEFNAKMFEKERDFQKTFEEALSTIRKDETRIKTDLRSTIDDFTKSNIELQTERNQLLDQISDNEKEIKNLKKLVESKNMDLESSKMKIDECTEKIRTLELEKQSIISEKISKMNQTVDSCTSYEEPFLDNIGIRDHEVLLMHCSDIEEQVKQLQTENISLRKALNISNNDIFSSEVLINPTKAKHLSHEHSISSDISKSSIHHHGGIYRSPNTSCSDYTFCPIPITEATDYEYLHDVLLKYMTGMETEILAKVVCTVMKFSSDETSRVLTFEQDRRNKFIRRIL